MIRLACFNHFRRNIKQYLQEGLVDSNSNDEFQQKLLVLKERWKKLDDNDCFYDWFCQYKVSIVQETMLKFVREEFGLGWPPQPFTTNASETTN